jgi:hypothetical protein
LSAPSKLKSFNPIGEFNELSVKTSIPLIQRAKSFNLYFKAILLNCNELSILTILATPETELEETRTIN